MTTSNHILAGKTITRVAIASDKEAIRFVTNHGEVVARCDADCCSHTWIEHVDLPTLGFPALVISAEDIHEGLPENQDREGDLIQFYGFKIVTDKGEILIDYRNESNGYYGGSLTWPGDMFYGGVHGQNKSKEEWVNLP